MFLTININNKKVFFWLISSSVMIIFMIVLGGLTRLTHSGLSIVEWKPITGIIPPFNQKHWMIEFSKYKLFPEYNQITSTMTLSEFKFIYMLEYIHRLAARITGVIFIIPFIYFLYKKILNRSHIFIFIIVITLGLIQGFIGWYMVKSGLNTKPYVNHFRLTMHLIMAFLIFSLIFWEALNLINFKYSTIHDIKQINNLYKLASYNLFFLFLQITCGGLVAGLKAGLIYNNFPLMGKFFIAPEVFSNNNSLLNFLNNPASIQFSHRILSIIVFISVIVLKNNSKKYNNIKALTISCDSLLAFTSIQLILGIITLINLVPTTFALMHQFNAIILWGNSIFIFHFLYNYKKR